jgi:uncharacterized protein
MSTADPSPSMPLPPTVVVPTTRDKSPFGLAAIAFGMIVCAHIAFGSWERVRGPRPPDRTIQVTGSAKKRIQSDHAEWQATVVTEDKDRTAAYRKLHEQVEATLANLRGQGLGDTEIRVSAATFQELHEQEVITEGVGAKQKVTHRDIMVGWRTTQSVTVVSGNVALVEKVSREVTALLEQGITITSDAPAYYYTKLADLKIEMLAAAAKDARTRAENMIRSAGGSAGGLGKLRAADMGVINVNPANSTETEWDGNNDTTSLEKDIITIVHASYALSS